MSRSAYESCAALSSSTPSLPEARASRFNFPLTRLKPMNKWSVLLADDHAVVRKGLRFLLDQSGQVHVVGEASDGREAIDLAQKLRPNLVIIDIQMPMLNGIDAAAQIVKEYPETAVIILSMYSDESYILRALNAGAKRIFSKILSKPTFFTPYRP